MSKHDSYDYSQLIKPFWAPPEWIFGTAWKILYILIAVSYGKVFLLACQQRLAATIILPFTLNLVFNFIFTPLRFGSKNNSWAVIDVVLILGTLIWAMVTIFPLIRWVTYIQIPYLFWMVFVAVLQITITYLNKQVSENL
jgi:translocator protein